MSDIYCAICVLISIRVFYKKEENINIKENSNRCTKNNTQTTWNQEVCEQYTLSFDIEHINTIQDHLKNILYDMTITSENMIELLYMEIKDVFIKPTKVTNMYR